MKVKIKYTAMMLGSKTVNENVKATLSFGEESGPYYDRKTPTTIHDTEKEALEYAFEECDYCNWLILPVTTFEK